MTQRYTIQNLLVMKKHFKEFPDLPTIVGRDEFRDPIVQDGPGFHKWFMECLNNKINTLGNLPTQRKMFDPFQTDFLRDKWAIERRLLYRERIYQFNSKGCRTRLTHLLSHYDD